MTIVSVVCVTIVALVALIMSLVACFTVIMTAILLLGSLLRAIMVICVKITSVGTADLLEITILGHCVWVPSAYLLSSGALFAAL